MVSENVKILRFVLAEAMLKKLWMQDLLSDEELAAAIKKAQNKISENNAITLD